MSPSFGPDGFDDRPARPDSCADDASAGGPPDADADVPATVCEAFQAELSALVDGELDSDAAASAMLHLESCRECHAFFDHVRRCVEMHRDISDPTRLIARVAMLTGGEFDRRVAHIEIVHRLASIFFQLAKAYVLTAVDPGFRTRVFERAVAPEAVQAQGRGFVDGVLGREAALAGGVDWVEARHWLNGRLKAIQNPLEKGKQLLREAIAADPSHEEARIYRAWLLAREDKRMAAAKEFRDIFRTALDDANRGHAATQLGLLHMQEGDHRAALACFRWLRASGLDRRDPRFFFAGFNAAVQYAALGRFGRAVASLRGLLDRHPERAGYVGELISQSETMRQALETDAPFAQALLRACPEFFATDAHGPTTASMSEGIPVPRGLLEFDASTQGSTLEI